MSRAHIDPLTYESIYTDTVVNYLDMGLDLKAARQQASEDMARAFTCDDGYQKDKTDEAQNDWTR